MVDTQGGEGGGGEEGQKRVRGGAGGQTHTHTEGKGNLRFEDPYEDEYEEEEEVFELDSDDEEEEGGGMDVAEDEEGDATTEKKVWRPGMDVLREGEELEYDPSAYVMYHCLTPEWPCLSFDIMQDTLGGNRTR